MTLTFKLIQKRQKLEYLLKIEIKANISYLYRSKLNCGENSSKLTASPKKYYFIVLFQVSIHGFVFYAILIEKQIIFQIT